MQLFSDYRGAHYPVSRIRFISARTHEVEDGVSSLKCHSVRLDEEDTVSVTRYELESILRGPRHIIPAEPGTFLLGGVEAIDQSVDEVWRSPIICYGIAPDGDVTPYTVDGPNDGLSEQRPILLPSGAVTMQAEREWKSIYHWFEAERNRKISELPEPPLPQEGDPAEVFDFHARWCEAQEKVAGR